MISKDKIFDVIGFCYEHSRSLQMRKNDGICWITGIVSSLSYYTYLSMFIDVCNTLIAEDNFSEVFKRINKGNTGYFLLYNNKYNKSVEAKFESFMVLGVSRF